MRRHVWDRAVRGARRPGWTEGVRQRPEPVVCGVHKDELRQQQGQTPGQVLRRVRA